jgi:L-threonylcarbamoyladenylate synthase
MAPEFPVPVDPAAVTRAVEVLRSGGLVALPTETVYGLAADADNPAAVRAVFAAKGRPADHPVIVHIADATMLSRWARSVPLDAERLVKAFWPGPLTLVLARSARAHDALTGGQDTVGLRAPAHPWARAVLREFGGALAAPSANRFGRISPTTAAHVRADLGEKPHGAVDLILDAGPCPVGIESTIVDLSGGQARLLRPGSISRAQLQAVLAHPVLEMVAESPRVSGGLEQHYAPRTPLELVSAQDLPARVAALEGAAAVLAPVAALGPPGSMLLAIAAAESPEEYARDLYSNLHRLDNAGARRLLVVTPPHSAAWEAVWDRLRKAAVRTAG